MHPLKTLLLGFLFFGVFGNASQAQTNTLNEFSITVQRSGVRAADVVLRGNNFEIVGSYIYDYTPRACYPCSQAQSPSFSGIFGLSSIYNPSGYINGTFYPKVYLGGSLSYIGERNTRIPRGWRKTTRMSVPAKLTGELALYEREQDVGTKAKALFYQENINLNGKANLSLFWYLNNPGNARIYEDKSLTYSFSAAATTVGK